VDENSEPKLVAASILHHQKIRRFTLTLAFFPERHTDIFSAFEQHWSISRWSRGKHAGETGDRFGWSWVYKNNMTCTVVLTCYYYSSFASLKKLAKRN
jgi:hypothetical protein